MMFGFRDSSDFADFFVNFAVAIFHIIGAVALLWIAIAACKICEHAEQTEKDLATIKQDIRAIRNTVAAHNE